MTAPTDPINQAAALLNAKSYQAAADVLQGVLTQQPGHPDALQLLGLALKNLGRLDEARAAMSASLAAAPNQPHVLNNLGGVLLRLNELDRALACFEDAVRLTPSYKDAWRNIALAWRRLGDLDQAERAIRTALKLDPEFVAAQETLGQILLEQGAGEAAASVLKGALARRPQSSAAWRMLGAAQRSARHYPEALEALERAEAIDPNSAETHALIGAVHDSLGNGEAARAAYRRAIDLSPEYEEAHYALSQNLWRGGDAEGFLHSYHAAEQNRPNAVGLRCGHAQTLIFLERFPEAERVLREAADRAPAHPRVEQLLGRVLLSTGQAEEGAARLERLMQAAPQAPHLRVGYARALMVLGDFKTALAQLDACDGELSHTQGLEQGALALRFICAKQLGLDEARRLNDYSAFVRVRELPLPKGFATIESFNAALEERLNALHTSEREPIEQTLRGGTQTLGRLFLNEDPVIQAMRDACAQVIEGYMRDLPDLGDHPFQRRRPATAAFAGSWSARLKGGGFHKNHIHGRGWLSSAYYVSLPPELGDGGKQGWLKFGQPHDLPGADMPPDHWVKPEPGLLALFPSYMWHGTEAFTSAQTRLTVAFDVQSDAPTHWQRRSF